MRGCSSARYNPDVNSLGSKAGQDLVAPPGRVPHFFPALLLGTPHVPAKSHQSAKAKVGQFFNRFGERDASRTCTESAAAKAGVKLHQHAEFHALCAGDM